MNENPAILTKKNVLRQRPRLLYIGANNNGTGYISSPHAHPHCEFMLVKSGTGKIIVSDLEYPYRQGDLIIYNKLAEHTEYMEDLPGREIIFMGVGNLRLMNLPPDCIISDKAFCIIPTNDYFPSLLNLMETLIAESEGAQPFHEAIAEQLLRIILLYIIRLAAFDVEITFKQNTSYIEAKHYFDEHFTQIDSLDSVCKSLYINKYYLTHLFKEQMGIPPIKYLINKRIALACRYLETTEMSVGEVAKACGYVDIGYFCRVFKSVTQITPLRHRYNYKNKKRQLEKELHASENNGQNEKE